MVALDSRTLWIAFAVAALIIGTLLISQFVLRRTERAMLLWGVGITFGAVGAALIGLRGHIPDFLSISIANAVLTLAWGVIAAGSRSFDGQQLRWPITLTVPLAQLVVFQAIPQVLNNPALRTFIGGVCLTSMICWALANAVVAQRAEQLIWRRGLIVVMCGWIVTVAVRIVAAFVRPGSTDPGTDTIAQTVTALTLMALVVLTGVIVTLISHERLDNRLADAAKRDFQTGAYNRAGLFERADDILTAQYASSVVLLADLDRFKSINDAYGHAVGDQVIVEFVAVASAELRPEDVLARYGGEEFCAIVADVTPEVAHDLAERIRDTFANRPITLGDATVHATVSIGTGQIYPGDTSIAAAIAAADSALYTAKAAGRNRVTPVTAHR